MKIIPALTCIVAYVITCGGQPANPPKVISVCDLLRDPAMYNGKVIAIRGTYFIGGHGLYLRGESCDGTLTTKGYRWPSLIWLSLTQQEMEARGQNFDRALRAEADVSVARERAERLKGPERAGTEKITATYTGLFQTRESLQEEVGRLPNGTFVANGFGPGNAAPGQLYIQSVRDIVVEFESPK